MSDTELDTNTGPPAANGAMCFFDQDCVSGNCSVQQCCHDDCEGICMPADDPCCQAGQGFCDGVSGCCAGFTCVPMDAGGDSVSMCVPSGDAG